MKKIRKVLEWLFVIGLLWLSFLCLIGVAWIDQFFAGLLLLLVALNIALDIVISEGTEDE